MERMGFTTDDFIAGVYYYLSHYHATKHHESIGRYYKGRLDGCRRVMWNEICTWYPDTYDDNTLTDKITTHSLIENYLNLRMPPRDIGIVSVGQGIYEDEIAKNDVEL